MACERKTQKPSICNTLTRDSKAKGAWYFPGNERKTTVEQMDDGKSQFMVKQ